MKAIHPKREGFFRLGVGKDKSGKKYCPDADEQEIKEKEDFLYYIFNKVCKETVLETVDEAGFEFVPTGKGRQKELVKKRLHGKEVSAPT